jgi:uncharacterized peroxidase-related enzyme
VTHHGAALAREAGKAVAETVVSARLDALPERMRMLHRYALKLTASPQDMAESDVQALRRGGLTDRDIVDANQVVAYFNYVNRAAEGLGVELEGYWPPEARERRVYRGPAEARDRRHRSPKEGSG